MPACPVHQPEIDRLKAAIAREREARLYAEGRANGLLHALTTMLEATAPRTQVVVTPPPPRPPPPARPQPVLAPQLVYFIQAGEGGPIKIGCSRSPIVRLNELQTGNAEKLVYCGAIPGGFELEQRLHERFASLRVAGEWFNAEPELVDYIRSVMGQPKRDTP